MIASPRELPACAESCRDEEAALVAPRASAAGARPLVITGAALEIDDVVAVARRERPVAITDDASVRAEMAASRARVRAAVERGERVYGVTTLPGALAGNDVRPADAARLQEQALWVHATGAGAPIPAADVRAAMLVRANSLLRGASGVRLELVQRLCAFLNAGVTPMVHELGSTGASGDLVPLTYVAGAITGHDASFVVDAGGSRLPSSAALMLLGLAPLSLEPKEALALVNGTSASAAIAAGVVHDARRLLALAIGAHMLAAQALRARSDAFDPFIHAHKPHRGQRWAARQGYALLHGSRLTRRDEADAGEPAQDPFSLRCLPQFLGPIADTVADVARDVTVEINSTTDNPLVDVERGRFLHGGNFLAQYVATGMDRLRGAVSLLVGHLDAQLAPLVTPASSGGLPASLAGDPARPDGMGLGGLQLTANSIAPLVAFHGQAMADRFPSHAEQFHQHVNGQAWNSALLAARQLRLAEQHVAIMLLAAVQAVDLQARAQDGTGAARTLLSPGTLPLYDAVRALAGRRPDGRPLARAVDGQRLDSWIAALAADVARDGALVRAVEPVIASLGALGDRR